MRRWRLWPDSLFGRHLLLIIGLILLAELLLVVGYHSAVQRPRAERMVSQVEGQVQLLSQALAMLDTDQQNRLATCESSAPGQLCLSLHPPQRTDIASGWLLRLTRQRLSEHLGRDVLFQDHAQSGPRLWWSAELAGRSWWLGLDVKPLQTERRLYWLGSLSLSALLALLGAALIQRHLLQPLQALQRAAHLVAQGRYQPFALPVHAPAELRALGNAFDHMAQQLQSADQERALMLAGLSHDLRTPLAKLRLAAEILHVEGEDALLAGMARNIEAADRIIAQFIDFARAGVKEEAVPCDLDELVNDVVSSQSNTRLQLASHQPSVGLLMCQPLAVRRALTNLIDNALKYSEGDVCVRWGCEAGLVFVDVQDQGPGIPQDELLHVTRPFVRRDQARGGPPGSGLGLAIVDRMAQQMGGELLLEQCPIGLKARLSWPF